MNKNAAETSSISGINRITIGRWVRDESSYLAMAAKGKTSRNLNFGNKKCMYPELKQKLSKWIMYVRCELKSSVMSEDLRDQTRKIISKTSNPIYKDYYAYPNDNVYSLTMNIDGISLCDKSNLLIWPVFFAINEISIDSRCYFDNVIIAGELSFSQHGDKPTRASKLNIINSNMYYGCLKCQQSG